MLLFYFFTTRKFDKRAIVEQIFTGYKQAHPLLSLVRSSKILDLPVPPETFFRVLIPQGSESRTLCQCLLNRQSSLVR